MNKWKGNQKRRLLALMLAFAMLMQQTSIGASAMETEMSTEAVTEVQSETTAPETQEETKASETQAATDEPGMQADSLDVETTEAPLTEAPTEAFTEPAGTEAATETATEAPATEQATEVATEKETEAVTEISTEILTEAEAEPEIVLDTTVKQEVFQKTVDDAIQPMVKYTVKVTNLTEGADAKDVSVKVLLADALSYVKEAGETPELSAINTLADADAANAFAAGELTDALRAKYAQGGVVLWKNQTIAAGAEKDFVFFASVKDGETDTEALRNAWLVNGKEVAAEKVQWSGAELLAVERELPSEFKYENNKMIVTATLSDPNILPEGAVFVVEKVELSDAEIEQIEAVAEEGEKQLANYAAYDMHFEVDGEEIEPQDGTVAVKIEYKKANDEDFGGETLNSDAAELQVLHLAEEAGATDVTTNTEVGAAGEVNSAEFVTDSFSVFVLSQMVDVDHTFVYEDDDVKITAVTDGEEKLLNSNLTELKLEIVEDRDSKEYKELEEAVKNAGEEGEILLGFRAYNFTFLKDGEEVEPTGKIDVTIKHKTSSIPENVPESFVEKTTFFQVTKKGSVKPVNAEIKTASYNAVKKAALTMKGTALIEAAQLSGIEFSRSDILSRLGIAQNFAVFAEYFKNNNHMEGSVAVQHLQGNDSLIGNTDAVTEYNPSSTELTISKKATGPNSKNQTYRFGVYQKGGDGSLLEIRSASITTDERGEGSVTLDDLSNGTYYVYEKDDEGKPITDGEGTVNGQKVTVGYSSSSAEETTVIGGVGNKSYIEFFELPGGQSSELFNSTNAGKSTVVVGSTNHLEDSDNNSIKWIVGSDGSKYMVNIEKTNIEKVESGFPIDFAAEMNSLSALSSDLAQAVDSGTVKVAYLPIKADGSVDVGKVLIDETFPFEQDQNKWDNEGLFTGGKLLVLNVDCTEAVNGVALKGMKVDGQEAQNWSTVANRVVWNFYTKDSSGNASPYAGKITYQGGLGTILAPRATVSCTASTNGSVIGKSVDHPSCEIHHIKLIETETKMVQRVECTNIADTRDASAKIGLHAVKKMEGRELTEDDVFTFTLAADDEAYAETVKKATVNNSVDGTVTFDNAIEITLEDMADVINGADESGIVMKEFHYTLTESGSRPGVTNDPDTKKLTLKAVYDRNSNSLTLEWTNGSNNQTFVNTYTTEARTGIELTKKLKGLKLTPGAFEFKLEKQNADGTWTQVGNTKTNDEDGSVSFADAIKVTLADLAVTNINGTVNYPDKTFTYRVSEVKPENANAAIEYDSSKHEFTVKASYNAANGVLTLTNSAAEGGYTFTNTYTTKAKTGVELTKDLEGLELTAGAFEFKLEKQNADGIWETIAEQVNDADGKVSFADAIEVTLADLAVTGIDGVVSYPDKTFKYRVSEVKPENADAAMEYDANTYEFTVKASYDAVAGKMTLENHAAPHGYTFKNKWTADASIPLNGIKMLEGRTLTKGEFSFEVYAEKNVTVAEDGKVTTKGEPLLKATNAKDGIITFGALTYTQDDMKNADDSYAAEKIFTYKVLEKAGSDKNITYDRSVKTVVVKVTYNATTGELKAALVKEQTQALSFKNTYDTKAQIDLDAEKKMEGRELTGDDVFTFTLTADNPAYAKTVKVSKATNGADGKIKFVNAVEITLADLADVLSKTNKTGIYTKTFHYTLTESGNRPNVTNAPAKKLTLNALYNKNTGELTLAWAEGSNKQVFTNKYEASGSLKLEAKKTLTGRKLEGGQFTFTLTGDGQNQTKTNNGDGSAAFDEIKYTQADAGKTYTYTVTESGTDGNGYTYSKESYTVTVTITDKGDGTLDVAKTITNSAGQSVEEMEFVNEYAASGKIVLEATKVHDKALTGDDFSFSLVEVDENGNEVTDGERQTVRNNAGGGVRFNEIKYDKAGTYYYKVSEVNGGQTIDGTTYDNTVYTVKVSVTDNGDGTLTAAANKTPTEMTFKNTYAASGEIELGAVKTYDKTLTGGEFSFTLVEVDAEGVMLKGGVSQTAKNSAGGGVTFEKIKYDKAGTHYYKVSEVGAGQTLTGITYDKTIYTVTVTVTDNNDGTLTATADKKKEEVTFKNTYAASGEIELGAVKTYDKTLTGGEFSFTLVEVDADGIKVNNGESQTATNNADGSVAFGAIKYEKAGTYYYRVSEVNGGQTIDGTTYDNTVYTVTVTVTDKGDGTLEAAADKTPAQVSFKNTYAASGEIELGAVKTYDKTLAGGEFSFTLVEVDARGNEITDGVSLTAANSADGSVTFDKITYDKAGTYYYKVSEVNGGQTIDGTTYDNTVYTVTVTVSDKGDGTLEAAADKTPAEVSFKNTYAASGEIELGAVKTYDKTLTGGEFSFTLVEVDESGNAVEGGVSQTAANRADGSVTFDKITYDKAGTYYYKVSEVNGGQTIDGITYDDTVYTVTVTVTDNGDGTLEVAADKTPAEVSFKNTYAASGEIVLGATKAYNRTLEGGEFSFTLVEVDESGNAVEGGVSQTAANLADGSVTFEAITYEEAGTYYYVVSEVNGGETIDGTTYDNTVYTVTVTVTDNGDGTLKAEADKTSADVLFSNTHIEAGEIILSATKSYNRALTGGEFAFTLVEVDENGNVVADGVSQTATNHADGSVTFDAIQYEETGIYYYVVSEVNGGETIDGITYDNTVYTVTVTVTQSEDGTLKAEADKTAADVVFTNISNLEGKLSLEAQKSMKDPEDELGTFEFVVKDSTGAEVARTTNDSQGTVSFRDIVTYTQDDIGKTYTYTVSEVIPDEKGGTFYDTTVYTVTVTVADNGDGTLDVATAVTTADGQPYTGMMQFVNDTTTARFDKADPDGSRIAGAELAVKDAEGNVVASWTTDGETVHSLSGILEAGKTYTLEETKAPTGYAKADPISFTLDENGTVLVDGAAADVVVMTDKKLKLTVNKTVLNGDEEVDGAELTLYDENGNVVDKWISKSGETHDFGDKIEAGKTYTLRETVTPDGYLVATDITFTVGEDGTITTTAKSTTDEAGNTVYLMEDALRPVENRARLTVTKSLSLITGAAIQPEDATFYVALFADEARTQRVSEVKAIRFTKSSVSDVTFENLGAGTYYVAETDAEGNVLDLGYDGEVTFEPTFADGNSVTLESDTFAGQLHFDNQFYDIPIGYTYEGELQITKKVFFGDTPYPTNETFYAGVFTDAAYTDLYAVLPLVMDGSSETLAVLTKITLGEHPEDGITYYVTETDENGVPLVNGADLEFHVTVEGSEVYLSGNGPVGYVTITNTYPEEEESEVESEVETETEKETEKKSAPRTGDDTNYWMYLFLMTLALGAISIAVVQKRREKSAR